MKRSLGWTAAVAAIAALWAMLLFAPELQKWVALAWAIGLPAAGAVVLARHRRKRVAATLRPYGRDFISLQDDLLGRPHTADPVWPDDLPVPTLVEAPHRAAAPETEHPTRVRPRG
ncbi:MAG: hypothetical protein IE923_04130 [Micrococcales bacterium]|nr:hypothetical protein [Micrococcales bacterium]